MAALRVPGALPALQLVGRAVGTVLGSTKFGRDIPDAWRLLARLQEPAASLGVLACLAGRWSTGVVSWSRCWIEAIRCNPFPCN